MNTNSLAQHLKTFHTDAAIAAAEECYAALFRTPEVEIADEDLASMLNDHALEKATIGFSEARFETFVDTFVPPFKVGDDVSRILNEFGCPAVISFDHDLGQFADGRIKPNAMSALHELIDRHLFNDLDLNNVRRVIVHTQNPSGMRNLQGLWDGFSADELQSGVKAEILPRTSITE